VALKYTYTAEELIHVHEADELPAKRKRLLQFHAAADERPAWSEGPLKVTHTNKPEPSNTADTIFGGRLLSRMVTLRGGDSTVNSRTFGPVSAREMETGPCRKGEPVSTKLPWS
jgi:hypothetical protein